MGQYYSNNYKYQNETIKNNKEYNNYLNLEEFKNFRIINLLSENKFTKVFKIQNLDDKKFYAMKYFIKDKIYDRNQIKNFNNEKIVMDLNYNPFIVDLYCSFKTKYYWFMILDYSEGGNLLNYFNIRKSLTLNEIIFISAQIILALEHIHLLNLIYRKLNIENIIIDRNGFIKWTDYGNSKFTICNCHMELTEYYPPEVILDSKYNKSVDWWGLGILMYELLVGKTPFYSRNHLEMHRNILENNPVFPEIINPKARNLIESFLEKNSKKRLGFSNNDIDIIKNHDFFKTIDWDKLKEKIFIPPIKIRDKEIDNYSFFNKNFIVY